MIKFQLFEVALFRQLSSDTNLTSYIVKWKYLVAGLFGVNKLKGFILR
jgi:hypothetical protein